MSESFGEMFRNKVISKGFAAESELEGCTDNEIQEYMQAQGVKRLPEVYLQILLIMGKRGRPRYIEASGDDTLRMEKASLQAILKLHNYPVILPDDAFVFYSLDSINFHYFLTDNDDPDPSVYVFSEYEFSHNKVEEHLSEYFLFYLPKD